MRVIVLEMTSLDLGRSSTIDIPDEKEKGEMQLRIFIKWKC
jgi:hypothetical protein